VVGDKSLDLIYLIRFC